ncbi:MAG: serine/threonine-protein kinase [Planctomycetota bacterium]
MSTEDEVRFLAKLVHRGHLDRDLGRELHARMGGGETLDDALATLPGWDEERVAKLRRTDAGERPEIPGHEVLSTLGQGFTADVFRAREKRSGRQVALKILKPSHAKDPVEVRAFVDEAKLLKRLDHPGIVKGQGPAKADGMLISRMEIVEGRTLQEYLEDGHQFDEEVAFRIILAVAEALGYMAEEDLVHRDVKPGNIMMSDTGNVKLIDLGFCVAQNARDREGTARGTVQYLSPEQAEGGAAADIRSDIYSLGVTLYQLTIGKLPFEGDEDEDVLRQHVMEKLSSPELKSRGFSAYLQYFIEKMMSKDAELRYQTWDELIADVREQVEGRASLDYRSSAGAGRGRARRQTRTTGRSRRG